MNSALDEEMNKRISSFWTFTLKHGYITGMLILAILAYSLESKEHRYIYLGFGSLIILINLAFYHDLATVYQLDDGLRFKKSRKEFIYPYSEIQEVKIERFINCQPVRIRTQDGKKFRFVTAGSLYWANKKLVNEIKDRSNHAVQTTSASRRV